jgi:folate-binding protein YgfZ
MDRDTYNQIRAGRAGFHEKKRGLISVHGKESVQFLDGMVTNDMKTLADGAQMLAAFPNAQGRLIALVRIQRRGERFIIETEAATREKLYQNLFQFTFAGDFFVVDLSEQFSYFEIFGPVEDVYHPEVGKMFPDSLTYKAKHGPSYFIANAEAEKFREFLMDENGCVAMDDELYETLRIESGVPKFGVDMDENTIVPELGFDDMISYTKGCYIGQEIIARIHFRGHVAKQLTGLVFEVSENQKAETRSVGSVPIVGTELISADGKNAGRVTSVTYSPKLESVIALAFVRYDFLSERTKLRFEDDTCSVKSLPFF